MSETIEQDLSGVSDTYLAPLYWKAMESQRPDTILKDEKAEALVAQMTADGYDFSRVRQIKMNELLYAMRVIFTREIDRYARDFLSRHPEAVVVHIGCGLDARFERVGCDQPDTSQVEWYDLDLPEVIELRRKLIDGEEGRYHLLGCSVLEPAWQEAVRVHRGRPFLFLAEGVFMYFTETQVKSLVLTLRDHFPGAELVFDGWRPFEIWLGNFVLGGLLRWGFWRGQELEGWGSASSAGDGIRLLDEWGYFDRPEPRLHSFRWMAPIFRLLKPMRVFHFQLGKGVR